MDLGEALLCRQAADCEKKKQHGSTNDPANGTAQSWLLATGAPCGPTQQVVDRLVSQRVYLGHGDAFGSELPGWFRIVFAQQRHLLCEGLRRMVCALDM